MTQQVAPPHNQLTKHSLTSTITVNTNNNISKLCSIC